MFCWELPYCLNYVSERETKFASFPGWQEKMWNVNNVLTECAIFVARKISVQTTHLFTVCAFIYCWFRPCGKCCSRLLLLKAIFCSLLVLSWWIAWVHRSLLHVLYLICINEILKWYKNMVNVLAFSIRNISKTKNCCTWPYSLQSETFLAQTGLWAPQLYSFAPVAK